MMFLASPRLEIYRFSDHYFDEFEQFKVDSHFDDFGKIKIDDGHLFLLILVTFI